MCTGRSRARLSLTRCIPRAHPRAGEGRVHACLRHQMNFLSEACRVEEGKLAATEQKDIRLRPRLAKVCVGEGCWQARRAEKGKGAAAWRLAPDGRRAAPPPPRAAPQVCSQERASFCRDVPPGKARVIKCLMGAMGDARFGAECRAELQTRVQVRALARARGGGQQGVCHCAAGLPTAALYRRGVMRCTVHCAPLGNLTTTPPPPDGGGRRLRRVSQGGVRPRHQRALRGRYGEAARQRGGAALPHRWLRLNRGRLPGAFVYVRGSLCCFSTKGPAWARLGPRCFAPPVHVAGRSRLPTRLPPSDGAQPRGALCAVGLQQRLPPDGGVRRRRRVALPQGVLGGGVRGWTAGLKRGSREGSPLGGGCGHDARRRVLCRRAALLTPPPPPPAPRRTPPTARAASSPLAPRGAACPRRWWRGGRSTRSAARSCLRRRPRTAARTSGVCGGGEGAVSGQFCGRLGGCCPALALTLSTP